MSETNGNGTTPKRVLSLDEARANKVRKGNDFITVQQCYDMVIQECAKVHEFYLEQIPPHVAVMIQDALVAYGLIKLTPEAQAVIDSLPATEAPAVPETPSGDTSTADTTTPPSDFDGKGVA